MCHCVTIQATYCRGKQFDCTTYGSRLSDVSHETVIKIKYIFNQTALTYRKQHSVVQQLRPPLISSHCLDFCEVLRQCPLPKLFVLVNIRHSAFCLFLEYSYFVRSVMSGRKLSNFTVDRKYICFSTVYHEQSTQI